jgi:AAA domain
MDKNVHIIRSDQPLPLPKANSAADGEAPEPTTAETNGKTSHAKPSRIKLIRFDDLKPGTEPEYLVHGLIPRAGLVVVWGPPKCGKSFWTMDLALHVALGWEYRGRKVQRGAVVYCAFEGQSGYGKRADAFRRSKLLEHTDPVPFYLVPLPMNFVAEHRDLMTAIRDAQTKPEVVVLDTLNRSLVGSESDDRDMGAYVKAADAVREAFGCAVIIIHHCGVDASRPRGHTSLTGAVDAQLSVKRNISGHIIVEVEWMKDAEEGGKVTSRLEVVEVATDTDGQPIKSCVVLPADDLPAVASAKLAKLPKAAQTALRALKEAVHELGVVPPASNYVPSSVSVVTFEQWRDYAYRRGISTSEEAPARRLAFKRASEHLIGGGHVSVWDGQVWPAA